MLLQVNKLMQNTRLVVSVGGGSDGGYSLAMHGEVMV
jgi:hypothetical protein